MSFLIVFWPGSEHVNAVTLAITTLGRCSIASLTASQSTEALMFTPHSHT